MKRQEIVLVTAIFISGLGFLNPQISFADDSMVGESHSKKKSNLPHFPFVSYPIGFTSSRAHMAPDQVWLPKGTREIVEGRTYSSTLSFINMTKLESNIKNK